MIRCIGIDRKKHVCHPWEKKTMCGIKILSKKISLQDEIDYYSCYECTY